MKIILLNVTFNSIIVPWFRFWSLIITPSAPKTGYCQADFFSQLFQKNPLSASGQAPVVSKSVGALSVRVALRAVARHQATCSWAGSALRA